MANREAQFRAIAAMFGAFARLDADAFARHLTEDVVFRPSGFVTGQSEFLGREAVRQNLVELGGRTSRERTWCAYDRWPCTSTARTRPRSWPSPASR
jgi:hypothetical protein